jgi:hypothetical protein
MLQYSAESLTSWGYDKHQVCHCKSLPITETPGVLTNVCTFRRKTQKKSHHQLPQLDVVIFSLLPLGWVYLLALSLGNSQHSKLQVKMYSYVFYSVKTQTLISTNMEILQRIYSTEDSNLYNPALHCHMCRHHAFKKTVQITFFFL